MFSLCQLLGLCYSVLLSSVSAVPERIPRHGPSYLPAPGAPRGVLSMHASAHYDKSVVYRKDAALSSHLDVPDELSLGGRNAERGEFPFIVTLQVNSPWSWTEYDHTCGGSIITHHTVLTAAHCLDDRRVNQMKVIAGKLYLKEVEETRQVREVTRFVKHRNYTSYGVSPNDVAVIFVEEPFTFNDFVRSIPLANPMAKESEGFAVVSGWGNTEMWPGEFYPSAMQTEILPLMSHEECLAEIAKEGIFLVVTKSMLCTGPLKKNYGPCYGDSGGPLVQNGALIGVVSWISGRCGYGTVSGFTRVSSFTEWILEVDGRIRHYNSTEKADDLGFYYF